MSDASLSEAKKKRRRGGTKNEGRTAIKDERSEASSCPVVPLGQRAGSYYYLSPSGELRVLVAAEHRRTGIVSLFDGQLDWLREAFPAYDKEGNVRPGAWSEQAASAWLVRACADQGLFDSTLPVRGLGVWRGDDGQPLAHCGDALGSPGGGSWSWAPAGAKRVEALYPAAPHIVRPAEQPASRDQGRSILEAVRNLWRFRTEVAADLVVGFTGAAMLGAYPPWRAHIYVTGERGAGKTWLAELVAAALGAQAQPTFNNFTEAGLRQMLTGEARALVLDESEHDDSRRVERVIELLRHMSSGTGAQTVRGSPGGRSQSFSVNGCAYLSSILHVPLKPQDRSRITVVLMDQLPNGTTAQGQADKARAAIAQAAKMSAALRSRVLARAGFFLEVVGRYREALLARGCDARQSDQLATLLAGRDVLTQDEAPEGEALAAELDPFAGMIAETQAEDVEESEGAQCLAHLYSSTLDLWHSGERQTVSQVVMAALHTTGTDARRVLGTIGLRVEGWHQDDPAPPRLLVANEHQGLARIFRDTRWAGGAWRQAMRYLPGAQPADRIRFAGIQQRATMIPAELLPREEPEDEGEAATGD